jgi:hypothetical protein
MAIVRKRPSRARTTDWLEAASLLVAAQPPLPARAASAPSSRRVAQEARDLHMGAAILALAALADSGLEHYRGSYHNPGMYAPLATGALSLGASLLGLADARARRHPLRDAAYALSAGAGVAGLCFHLYNVTKRPGGLSWENLFYGAPVGAPIALTLAGLLGRSAETVRELSDEERREAGRALGALVSAGLVGTVAEAGLLHFRGAFHNPAMTLPVSLPPLAAALLAGAVVKPTRKRRRWSAILLKATAGLGFLGVGFHAFGVARNMGGWRNWSQNILNGPPLPAPPSFTGLAFAGLAALKLMDKKP